MLFNLALNLGIYQEPKPPRKEEYAYELQAPILVKHALSDTNKLLYPNDPNW